MVGIGPSFKILGVDLDCKIWQYAQLCCSAVAESIRKPPKHLV